MFLTTEPSLAGKNYNALRVIYATVTLDTGNNLKSYPSKWDTAIENALSKLHSNATNLGADGVIGVHVSTSENSGWISATVMGTAIKFF
ncbi:MAG: heavy metal-binding domain-containing protein [Ktedonobacteraceae bacterium]|nr:heavy metal-binding domain-containing protein [Ktedonobacteraceae bacterium]